MSDLESRISQLEAQLQEADATATAMGLALTEARIENEQLREALSDIIDWRDNNVCLLRGLNVDMPDRHVNDARKALANTSEKEGA